MTALSVLRTIERFALVAIFLGMVALYFCNVVVRAIGGTSASSFVWIEEAVRIMNLFLVFLAIGVALEYGRHVGVHTWRDRIMRVSGIPLTRIIDFVGFFFSLYVMWLGYTMAVFVFATGQRSPTLDLEMGWIYVAPAIGFGLLALRYLLSFFGLIDRFSSQAREEA
jgi:TRAP-type C4-dicarboxylate transport system permease small subunit